MEWQAGKGFAGGSFGQAPTSRCSACCAFDIQTGKPVWELPQAGDVGSWGGVLTTAGGVVFFGEDSGALAACRCRDRKTAGFSDQRALESFADDLHVRQQTMRRDRIRV